MARATVGEFNQQFVVIACDRLVTFQAESHIEDLRVFGNSHFAHVAVTVFAVLPCGHMRAMIELNKIRHLRDWYPLKGFATENRIFQRFEKLACLRLLDLVMAAPALGF